MPKQGIFSRITWSLFFLSSALPANIPISLGNCPRECQCTTVNMIYMNCGSEDGLPVFPSFIPPAVEILSLYSNKLTNIPEDALRNLTELKTLNLRSNRLRLLSRTVFRDLVKLRSLNIGFNRLSMLPGCLFDRLHNLQELYLNNNALKSIPEELFQNLPSLKQLYLQFNRLKEFPGSTFRGTYSLQGLSLANNALTSIHVETFLNVSSLHRLNLAGNRITSLSANLFRGLSLLATLELQNNFISTIHEGAFIGLKTGIFVLLNGNPFYCDCQLRWLKAWITRKTKYIHSSRLRTTCSQPYHLKNRPLIYVTDDQFRCEKGRWTEWSSWGACSVSCGNGRQESTRNCTKLTPDEDGTECIGRSVRTRKCQGTECRTSWAAWSEWTDCSRTCSFGVAVRTRLCKRMAVGVSNDSCEGVSQETRVCSRQQCIVDGAWGSWSLWSPCSVTCSWGNRVRTRNCNNPRPQHGGKSCPVTDRSVTTQICYLGSCPVHGGWSFWSYWSPCNSSCGTGTRTRHRICNNPTPQYGGDFCNGTVIQQKNCSLKECSNDGQWSSWSRWSVCSRTCSVGWQVRSRNCSNHYVGQSCRGNFSDVRNCNVGPCLVHGAWEAWTSWSDCSKTCNTGSRFRNRTCSNPPPEHGGRTCPGNYYENIHCDLGSCPVHGLWTAWSAWSGCSTTCASGTRSRRRSCSNPSPQHGGLNCPGNSSEEAYCNFGPCPNHGQWTTWSLWSECSKSCGKGTKNRSRTCNNTFPRFGGRNCSGEGKQIMSCALVLCPLHGKWSEWSKWSECSESCSTGVKFRTRTCSNPSPRNGGQGCTGDAKELEGCQPKPCITIGSWSEWSNWTDCSTTCGNGTKSRHRNCENLSPRHGEKTCTGDVYQRKHCFQQACSSVGEWTEWSHWTDCSTTCDVGQQTRIRFCNGSNCKSVGNETVNNTDITNKTDQRVCYPGPCPEPGLQNEWTPWSQCSSRCGFGKQHRLRNCSAVEGDSCAGSLMQVKVCYRKYCKVNGGWSSWSAWTECSLTCGIGVQEKLRFCTNPKPQGGGDLCHGKDVTVRPCIVTRCAYQSNANDSFWSSWARWSQCSANCSRRYRTRTRYCRRRLNPFLLGNCSKDTGPIQVQSGVCEMQACASWNSWYSWGVCSKSCGSGLRKRVRACRSNTNEKNCQGDYLQTERCNTNSCHLSNTPVTYPPKINLERPSTCLDPEKPINGYYKVTNQGGSRFTMHYCKKHYKLHGPRLRHCESDGTWSDYVPNCLPVCGESTLTHQRLRIFGGTESPRGLWPWQVVLTIKGVFHCGGSLVAEDWVVTAAHCVLQRLTKEPLAGLRVHLGVYDISSTLEDPSIQRIDSLDIVPHPDFNWETFDSDLALIQLQWKANVTDYVRPVCLPNKQQRRKVVPGSIGVMLGWGFTETDSPSTTLRQVNMPVVRHSTCQKAYKKDSWPVTANMICAGYARRAKDTCKQDSGGGFLFPFSKNKKKKWFLGGIISWGNPQCGIPGKYSVLTDINSRFTRWIKNYIYN